MAGEPDALVDERDWPILVVRADDRLDEDGTRMLVDRLDAALDHAIGSGSRIGLVFDIDRVDRAGRAVIQTWMGERAADLAIAVVAAALVVPASTVERNRELMAANPELYPFAPWCAASIEECHAWVRERV